MDKDLDKKLEHRRIKPTAMRQLILNHLVEENEPMALSELQRKFDKVDRVTIYRTLQKFLDNKLVHTIEDGSGSVKYAVCADDCTCEPEHLHVHFHCTECGHTYCLNELPIPTVELPEGYEMKTTNYTVKGICPKCS